ncbi:hypothetical protein [Chryseobacterium salviniae]|uniref:Uncharacterized protein n=1 Tax=Chryseobacterium salviniae TaxID=3101750 RepID=A0ABU6HTW8_9FLAO|nr:hypothetical protein [Chryseobacterium sp. T9W2-O]MEC3875922.1 hypothetical protein [Chryseobacterium sp. T9W2-O]
MKRYLIDVLLFFIAYILVLPLTFINYFVVLSTAKDHAKGYFRSSAVNIDKFGNREFRTLWNKTLRKNNGYKFGNPEETISSALGKNERDGTLSSIGKVLTWILNLIDKKHGLKSIVEF